MKKSSGSIKDDYIVKENTSTTNQTMKYLKTPEASQDSNRKNGCTPKPTDNTHEEMLFM